MATPGSLRAALVRTHPCCPQVQHLVSRCTCPVQFPMIKLSEGKYRVGDSDTLIFVRVSLLHPLALGEKHQESCSAPQPFFHNPPKGASGEVVTIIPKAGKLSPAIDVCMDLPTRVCGTKPDIPRSQSLVSPSNGSSGML